LIRAPGRARLHGRPDFHRRRLTEADVKSKRRRSSGPVLRIVGDDEREQLQRSRTAKRLRNLRARVRRDDELLQGVLGLLNHEHLASERLHAIDDCDELLHELARERAARGALTRRLKRWTRDLERPGSRILEVLVENYPRGVPVGELKIGGTPRTRQRVLDKLRKLRLVEGKRSVQATSRDAIGQLRAWCERVRSLRHADGSHDPERTAAAPSVRP
jgi:hypothetical protein